MAGRLTLGLYNSYDPVRFHDAMRRALARIAPVAMAFDCNVATFGFPYDEGRKRESKNPEAPDLRTPVEVAEFVADSTTIGEGGKYFIELAQKGRFQIFDFPRKAGFPPQLGLAVATTERPDAKNCHSPLDVAHLLAKGKSVMLVIGLGPHGLPKEVLQNLADHLELTGKGLSFETATAMAAMPALIYAHLQHVGVKTWT